MSHDPHEFLPGYSPGQVLHDGCHECETRGQRPDLAINGMDPVTFGCAWRRAAQFGKDGLPDAASAEFLLNSALWAVQVQLERRGIPIGEVPCGVR